MRRLTVVAAAATLAGLALVAGCAQRRPVALPRDHKAPMLYVALGDSTVEGIGATSPAVTYVARLTVDFNAALTRQARRYGVEVVDLYKPSQTEIPRQPELLAADGYHPSDLGYARWAELLWRGVEKRIGHRSAQAE